MAVTINGTRYQRRAVKETREERDARLGITDPLLTWSDALALIGSRGKGYGTFKAYRAGIRINGVTVKLHTTPRPGGLMVSRRQAEQFKVEYEAAASRSAECRVPSAEGGRALKLVGGSGGAGRYAPALAEHGGDVGVGRRLDVRA